MVETRERNTMNAKILCCEQHYYEFKPMVEEQ